MYTQGLHLMEEAFYECTACRRESQTELEPFGKETFIILHKGLVHSYESNLGLQRT